MFKKGKVVVQSNSLPEGIVFRDGQYFEMPKVKIETASEYKDRLFEKFKGNKKVDLPLPPPPNDYEKPKTKSEKDFSDMKMYGGWAFGAFCLTMFVVSLLLGILH